MEYVAACEDALYICLKALIYHRTGGNSAHLHSHASGKFVFRDQSYREEQRITGILFLGSRYRFSVSVHLCNSYSFQTFFPLNIHHCVAQFQRDTEIIQALYDISLEPA